eukprot:1189708-Prorocentrum_minimum.AAC.1
MTTWPSVPGRMDWGGSMDISPCAIEKYVRGHSGYSGAARGRVGTLEFLGRDVIEPLIQSYWGHLLDPL